MGEVIKFSCRRCGHEKRMRMGVGMHWDLDALFSGVVNGAKEGRYGEEWKLELMKDPSLALNVSDEIYVCPSCGCFSTGINLDLYKPAAESLSTADQSGRKYGTDLTFELSREYQLYKNYPHLCEKCNEQMKVYNKRNQEMRPSCPKCSGQGDFVTDCLWD